MNKPFKQTINTDNLTAQVHCIVSDFFDVSPQCVELIITEALYQAALRFRQGHAVELEHIGKLSQLTTQFDGAVTIDFKPNPTLKDSGQMFVMTR